MAALLAAAVAIQVVRDRGWRPYEPSSQLLWIRPAPSLERVTLGFASVVADVYWIRAVVYYGGARRQDDSAPADYSLLHPLLELVTTLDPRFRVAYRFGAIFLTEAYPNGPGRPDLAIGLLQRATTADGPRWEYMHDIGFVYYWWLRDYPRAAEWFEKAADAPGGPAWLRPLAATTLAKGGDRESSRLLWRQLALSSDVQWLRDTAELRLAQLDVAEILDQLNAAADRFAVRTGGRPRSWDALIAGERLRGIPLDPAGVPFVLDALSGRISVSQDSPLWPIPPEILTSRERP
jgi:hypothetical protein